MAIGINELDYYDDESTTTQDIEESISESEYSSNEDLDDRGIISEFLKSKGIEDISKIKYEGEDDELEEVSWDNLDSSEKLTILNQLNSESDNDLDDSEVQLINAIRTSKMSPAEYLNYVARSGVDLYVRNTQGYTQDYEIDQYTDDDLYVSDLITRMGRENITDDEAREALEKAKSNESLFKKQINAMRNEYKLIEDLNRQLEMYMAQQYQQDQYNQFANSIRNLIIGFNEFKGFDLNMDQEDKEELYDFITGFDEAGNSILGKAINNPEILVKMAWFALHGDQMLDDISDYIKQQITQVRKDSYNKGIEDVRTGNIKSSYKKPVTAYKPKSNIKLMSIDDLD